MMDKKSTTTKRPWGTFETFDTNVKMKRITVKKGEALSLQSHEHREEYWILLSGKADVCQGVKTFLWSELGSALFIEKNMIHRVMAHYGDVSFLEFQVGNILSEDDIIRYDDYYDRVSPPSS